MMLQSHSHLPVLTQPSHYYHLLVCNRHFQAWAQRPWEAHAHHIEHGQLHAMLRAVAADCYNSFCSVKHVTECLTQHWMWAVAIVPTPPRKAQLLVHLCAHARQCNNAAAVYYMEVFWAGGHLAPLLPAAGAAECAAVESWRDMAFQLLRQRIWGGVAEFGAQVRAAAPARGGGARRAGSWRKLEKRARRVLVAAAARQMVEARRRARARWRRAARRVMAQARREKRACSVLVAALRRLVRRRRAAAARSRLIQALTRLVRRVRRRRVARRRRAAAISAARAAA